MALKWQGFILFLILIIAASLRWSGLDWDGYQHYHPDERYITWVATTIEAPTDLTSALTPHSSTFNPFYWRPGAESEGIIVLEDEPRSFAYGHLPLYLGVIATRAAEGVAPALRELLPTGWLLTRDLLNGGDYNEFRHLTAVSRALTALFDLGTVCLVFLLGRRVYTPVIGLLAAAFLALNVMHVQLAHFFTVDPFLTFFSVAAILSSVQLVSSSTRRLLPYTVLAAASIGLAVGSKFSAVLLLLPLAVALWLKDGPSPGMKRRLFLAAVGVIVVVFAVTNPFALLDWSCSLVTPAVELGPLRVPALNWGSCYLENVLRQSAMVRGDEAFDFARQYVGTAAYFYPIVMQLRWGMGYLLGVSAFAGFAWATIRGVRYLSRREKSAEQEVALPVSKPELVVLSWTVAYFLITGSFFAKFMRYMQPLTPFLMVYAAAILWRLPARRRWLACGVVLAGTALYAVAFVSMYDWEHPWNEASQWIYDHATPGALFASELWDDPLPSSMTRDGEFFNRHVYDFTELNWLSGTGAQDDEQKLKLNLSRLAQADYVTLASNRGYGVVSRLEELYPLSAQYYRLLFQEELGFEVVHVSARSPRLGDFTIWPDRFGHINLLLPPTLQTFLDTYIDLKMPRADESFTVYDQPLAIVFQNTGHLTVDEMLQEFDLP